MKPITETRILMWILCTLAGLITLWALVIWWVY